MTRKLHLLAALGIAGLAAVGGHTREDGPVLPVPAIDTPRAAVADEQTAVFAGGCFWGVEGVFRHVKGVKAAASGYTGGDAQSAHYQDVSRGDTGHAEAVRVVYDPSQTTYGELLQVFFGAAHDPTQLDRQGPDVGRQYRSEIFYANAEQRDIAQRYIEQLERAKVYRRPIATRIEPLRTFFPAEAYHQNYMALHPGSAYIVINDLPKLSALKTRFPALYRPAEADR